MPNTYSQIYIQVVFAVKGRQCYIKESFREELQQYMAGVIARHQQKLYAVYCMPDHTHILVSLKPSVMISDIVRDIKASSSGFIKERKWVNEGFSWQEGYGAFSYHKSQAKNIVQYILSQPEHHKMVTFREEYLEFLKEFEIDYNEKYLFEFYD